MQARRHQYLSAMGIQVWQLRDTVPTVEPVLDDNPVSRFLTEQHLETDVTSSSDALPEFSSTVVGNEIQVSASVTPEAAGVSEAISSVATEPSPEFRLASIVFPGCGMVVTRVPTEKMEPLSSQQLNFIKNSLLSIGATLPEEPVVTFFNWPMLRSPGFDQGENAAREASQAFISGQKSKHSLSFILLMGEDAGRYLLPHFETFSTACGKLLTETTPPTLLTHAIQTFFSEPYLKRDLWRDIQSLRYCLDQS